MYIIFMYLITASGNAYVVDHMGGLTLSDCHKMERSIAEKSKDNLDPESKVITKCVKESRG